MAQNYLVVGVYYGSNVTHHRHITKISIYKPETESNRSVPVADAIKQIESGERIYFVHEGGKCTNVKVVAPTQGPKYLRTNGDSTTKDNLMNLPYKGA
jgi:hypothetical protein